MGKQPTRRQLQKQVKRQVKRQTCDDVGKGGKIHTFNEHGHFVDAINRSASEWDFPSPKQTEPPLPSEVDDDQDAGGEDEGDGDVADDSADVWEAQNELTQVSGLYFIFSILILGR
jgi:hypothetical protein